MDGNELTNRCLVFDLEANERVDYLLGHNLLDRDLPVLRALLPTLALRWRLLKPECCMYIILGVI